MLCFAGAPVLKQPEVGSNPYLVFGSPLLAMLGHIHPSLLVHYCEGPGTGGPYVESQPAAAVGPRSEAFLTGDGKQHATETKQPQLLQSGSQRYAQHGIVPRQLVQFKVSQSQ